VKRVLFIIRAAAKHIDTCRLRQLLPSYPLPRFCYPRVKGTILKNAPTIMSQFIPNHLRRFRKARGLSQRDVSRILGLVSTSMISRWEKGSCLPQSLNLFRLAAVYRTMVDALYVDLLRSIREELRSREAKQREATRPPHAHA